MAITNPAYSIDIDEMDRQDAHWLRLIEEFRSTACGNLVDRAGIAAAARTLEQLQEYTVSQFASEEALLAEHHYPHLQAHKKQHQELTACVAKLQEELRTRGTGSTPLKLSFFVTVWLLEHITQEDDKYACFILGKAPCLAGTC